MRKITVFLIMILAVSMAAAPSVMARGSEVSTTGLLNLDKTAPGTKLTGPLTLHYEFLGEDTNGCDIETDMYVFLRLRKGYEISGFTMGPVNVCYEDITTQRIAVEGFIQNTVIRQLFMDSPAATFAIKSIDQAVDEFDLPSGIGFTILDVVIAVQD